MKESFYFPHDYEPTSDPKIQSLLGEYGGLGYGVYWRIVEMLHSDEDHKLPLKQYIFLAIAKQMLTSAEQIQAIITFAINTSELFVSDGDFFWSLRVNKNFSRRQDISEKRAVAGRLGAIAKQNLANASKEKKRKEKKKNNTPLTPLTEIQQIKFDMFWEAYPNKKSKGQAETTFAKIDPDEQLLASMIATIEQAKTQDMQWIKDNGQFIPHPSTWLNAKGWENENPQINSSLAIVKGVGKNL